MNLTIIDADFISFWACHNKKDKPIKTLNEVYKYIDDLIIDILKQTKANKFIGFLSSGQTFRHKQFDQYKANRKSIKLDFIFEAKSYLKQRYQCFKHLDLEADDLCLIAEKQLKNKYNIIVCSTDKDILKTEGLRYSPKDKNLFNINKNDSNYHFWTSMITGDVIDNIKGLPKKGIKYAEKLFNNPDILIDSNYHQVVFNEYVNYFGEYKGIEEFYKNYKMLKILDDYPGIEIKEDMLLDCIKNEFEEKNIKG